MGNNFLIKDVFYLKLHCCVTQEIVLRKDLAVFFLITLFTVGFMYL